jgi:hypothetical protein
VPRARSRESAASSARCQACPSVPSARTHQPLCLPPGPAQRLHPGHREPSNAACDYEDGWTLTFAAPSALPLGRLALSAFLDCCGRPLDYLAAAAAADGAGAGPAAVEASARSVSAGRPPLPMPDAAGAAPGGTGAPGFRVAGAPAVSAPAAGGGHAELQRQLQAAQLSLCRLRLQQRCREIERQIGQLRLQGAPAQQPASPCAGAAGAATEPATGAGGGEAGSGDAEGGAALICAMLPPRREGPLHRSIVGREFELVPADAPPLSHIDPLAGVAAARLAHGAAAAAAAVAALAAAQARAAFEPPPGGTAAAGADPGSNAAAAAAAKQREVAADAAAPAAPRPPAAGEAPCIICLSNAKEAGFLHRDTVHRCVCRECAAHVRVGGPCPLCREPVAAILKVY